MATQIELNGQEYSLGRMSAMQQFHVSRRIAPLIPTLIPVFLKLKGKARVSEGGKISDDALAEIAEALQPLVDGLAQLKDEDAEYVIGACLSVVQRRQPTGWARVWNGALMFDDMDLATILPLAVQVITANLGPFIQGLLTSQQSGPEATQAG